MIKAYLRGASAPISAIDFVKRHGLWRLFLCPLALSAVLFVCIHFAAASVGTAVADAISGRIRSADEMPVWGSVLSWVGYLMARIVMFVAMVYVGGYLVLLLMSPMLSYVASLAVFRHTGRREPWAMASFVHDVLRGIAISMRNMLMQALLLLVVFVAGFIPVVPPLTPVLYWLVSAFYYGFSMADYVFEARRMSISASVAFARRNRAYMLGLGTLFALLVGIPFVGIYLAAFISPLVVIGTEFTIDESSL